MPIFCEGSSDLIQAGRQRNLSPVFYSRGSILRQVALPLAGHAEQSRFHFRFHFRFQFQFELAMHNVIQGDSKEAHRVLAATRWETSVYLLFSSRKSQTVARDRDAARTMDLAELKVWRGCGSGPGKHKRDGNHPRVDGKTTSSLSQARLPVLAALYRDLTQAYFPLRLGTTCSPRCP